MADGRQVQGQFNMGPGGGFNFDLSSLLGGLQGGGIPGDFSNLFQMGPEPRQGVAPIGAGAASGGFLGGGQDIGLRRSQQAAYLQALPQLIQQQQQASLMQNLLGSLLGGGQGSIGGIIPLVKQAARPEQRAQREALTNQITSQGGDLASGQAQAALGNLFGQQQSALSGSIVQALLGQLGPMLGLFGQLGSAALR